MPRLLITDDDLHLRRLVRTYADIEGYQCEEADCGAAAIEALREKDFDLVILDVMMPGPDGFETLSGIRRFSQIPVIMLTARDEEYDRLLGFRLGVDDYVSKPFSPKELMARIGAVLKRSNSPNPNRTLDFGELSISPESRTVILRGQNIALPPKEFDLLLYCAENQGRILTKRQIYENVWDEEYFYDDSNIMAIISLPAGYGLIII